MKLAKLLPLGLLVLSINAYAAKVDITNPTPGTLELNQTFVLNVSATEFQIGLAVQGGGFKISDLDQFQIDPLVLRLNGFSPDLTVWESGFSGTDAANEEFFFSKFAPGPSTGSFNIGTLSFTVVGFGETTVALSAPSFYEWGADTQSGAYPNANLIQYGSLVVSVADPTAPVPVPAAAWLFGTGLLAFGSSFRRNRLA